MTVINLPPGQRHDTSLRAVGSWEEVLLISKDFTVSQNFFELVLQDANFCLEKLALAFLTACVYLFLTSLKSCISRGLFDANAECHRMFLCWSRADRSGLNQGLYLFLVQHFLNGACLFKMVRKALLKNNQASSTDGMRSMAILQMSLPHCACRCTHTCLLPFLSKLCTGGAPIPQAESTLGDGPGACWTFLGALKHSSQQLNRSP